MTLTPYRFALVDGLLLAEVEVSTSQFAAGIRRRFLIRHPNCVAGFTGTDQLVALNADESVTCTCGALDLCEHVQRVQAWLSPPPDRPRAAAVAA